MQVELKDITDIIPHPHNENLHTSDQLKMLAESIKQYGWTQPIVVDKDNVIVIGHGRYLAAKELEMKQVPVKVIDLPPAQIDALRIADNRLNEMSRLDNDLLKETLDRLQDEEVVTGYTDDETFDIIYKDEFGQDEPAVEETSWKGGDGLFTCGKYNLAVGEFDGLPEIFNHKYQLVFYKAAPNESPERVACLKPLLDNDALIAYQFSNFTSHAYRVEVLGKLAASGWHIQDQLIIIQAASRYDEVVLFSVADRCYWQVLKTQEGTDVATASCYGSVYTFATSAEAEKAGRRISVKDNGLWINWAGVTEGASRLTLTPLIKSATTKKGRILLINTYNFPMNKAAIEQDRIPDSWMIDGDRAGSAMKLYEELTREKIIRWKKEPDEKNS